MAMESTNDWTIENKRRQVNDELSQWIIVDLYKGSNFRATARYLIMNEERETDDEVVIRKWDAINKAKSDWLEEQL